MRNLMLKAVATAAVLLSAPAIAHAPVAPTYNISLEVHDGSALVASPSLRVEAGKAATFMSGSDKGANYTLRFTTSPVGKDLVQVDASYDVTLASGRHLAGGPKLTVKLGEQGMVRVGEEGDYLELGFTLIEAKPAN